MSKFKVPVIYDDNRHKPLPDGQKLEVAAIPLDDGNGNFLKATDSGLAVNPPDFISSAPGNGLTSIDGFLYVEEGVSADRVSPPLYVDDAGKLVVKLDPDGPLIVTERGLSIDMSRIATGVSDDEDNILSEGSDGKPYFPGDLGKL